MLYVLLVFLLGIHLGMAVVHYINHRFNEPIPGYVWVSSIGLAVFAVLVFLVG